MTPEKQLPRPNILLITLSSVRRDALGCYGGMDVQTPVLDQLASEGVRFDDAVTVVPITLPSHASIFTGLLPPRHGVRDDGPFRMSEERQTLAESLKQSGYATAAFIGSFDLAARWGLGQGFDKYDDAIPDHRKLAGFFFGSPQRPANFVVDAALAWISGHISKSTAQPFFAWVHFFDATSPYRPPAALKERYPGNSYFGEVAFVDEQVGRLIGALKEARNWENTLTIVLSDHGEGLGEHDESAHGRLLYEPTIRIPMIWHSPKFLGPPRVDSARLVANVDVMPTLLTLLGIAVPPGLDGENILHPAARFDRYVILETAAPFLRHGWSTMLGARWHDRKYINAPAPEYYLLASDPGETENLFESDTTGVVAAQRLLQSYVAAMGIRLTRPQAAVMPHPDALTRLEELGFPLLGPQTDSKGELDPKVMMADFGKHQLARSLLYLGRPRDAVQVCTEILNASPNDAEIWSQFAAAAKQVGAVDEALHAVRRAAGLQPFERHWIALAELLWFQEKWEAGDICLAQLERIDPNDGAIFLLRGDRAVREGRIDDALRLFEIARNVDPTRCSASSHAACGDAFALLGDDERARLAYETSLSLDPDELLAVRGLADLEHRSGRVEAEVTLLRQLSERNPTTIQYANRLAKLFISVDRRTDAVDALKSFVARNPTDPAGIGNLGNVYSETDQPMEAIAQYRRALEMAPDYPFARLNLAKALAEVGDVYGAISEYRTLLADRPDHVDASYRLMRLLATEGRVPEAFEELQRLAANATLDWDAIVLDEQLEALVGDPQFAPLRAQHENK